MSYGTQFQTVTVTSSSQLDTTAYTSNVAAGYLEAIIISTGLTASTGLSSTGVFVVSGDRTGIQYLRVAPPGAGGATYYPRVSPNSSSGGAYTAFSTTPPLNLRFPIVEERIKVQTSSGSDASAGYSHTIKVVVGY